MSVIMEFDADFEQRFPDACTLLRGGPLVVHEGISRVTLHGSRGPAGGATPDADLDLCLLVDAYQYPDVHNGQELLKEILYETLANWRGKTKLDVRVIFDTRNCQLKCFSQPEYNPGVCAGGGFDCFGTYTVVFGSPEMILNSNMNIKLIYPCVTVWKKTGVNW